MEWTPERFAQVREMRKAGVYVKNIAKALGTSKGAIYVACKNNDMPIEEMEYRRPPKHDWTPERVEVLYACAACRSGYADAMARVNQMAGNKIPRDAVEERYKAACQEVEPLTPLEKRPVIHFWTPPPEPPKVVQIVRLAPRTEAPPPMRKKVPWEGEGGFSMFVKPLDNQKGERT